MNCRAFVLMTALVLFGSLPLAAQTPASKAPAAAQTDVINLNTASAAQIAALPGIGPKTADLIVQYREKNGSFKKIEEIMNVKGIGEKSFLKLKSRLTVTVPKTDGR
jgi:competence protein ComEA